MPALNGAPRMALLQLGHVLGRIGIEFLDAALAAELNLLAVVRDHHWLAHGAKFFTRNHAGFERVCLGFRVFGKDDT